MLMIGNGVQATLIGIRGAFEGFDTLEISIVTSAYFVGFLGGSRLAPDLIRRVGHVRVFAALGSLISAVIVLYPAIPDWQAWTLMRLLIGFSFSGVYVTAESWLNNASTNETRGQALSLYMIVQMIGIIVSQALLNVGAPSGFVIFIIPSVLVSLAFMPILLTSGGAPGFETIRPLSLRSLFAISPLGFVGMLLTGMVFSTMFGMASVWGTLEGLSVGQISVFVGALYVGGLVLQYPIGWMSDRWDRRKLVVLLSLVCAVTMLIGAVFPAHFALLVVLALILGGALNPIYSLLIAHTNDFLRKEDMASASAGLIFLNGLGAIAGPLVTGWIMEQVGPRGFFLVIAITTLALGLYGIWRMSRRRGPSEAGAFVPLSPSASPVAVEAVLDRSATDDGPAR
jgi:MFS family permease